MPIDPRLNQLHDLHLPTALATWPWASGWYVLIGVLCLFLILGAIWASRRHRDALPKKTALKLLKEAEATFKHSNNLPDTCAIINHLLKRVALVYHPREQVAALYGQEWLRFLNHTSKHLDFFTVAAFLTQGAYQSLRHADHSSDIDALFRLSRTWIEQRGQPCSS